MGQFAREEVEAAFAEFLRLGAQEENWPAWADLFTDDALYEEHNLGVFHGRAEIKAWIVDVMKEYGAMTVWPEWWQIEDDKVWFYIWNNLPDPTGEGRSFQFPNTTLLRYAGNGQFDWEADFYNPADAERVFKEWMKAGGRKHSPQDHSLRGVEGWAPEPSSTPHSREEVEREFLAYRDRGRLAVSTGDWNQWADQFTADAKYLEHHFGRFNGQDEIRAWINGVMQPFPTMEFPVASFSIEGNRVCALIPNVLPDPKGGDAYYGFDVFVILHYAGNAKWSYEEDVYSPIKSQKAIGDWVKAGGVIPT